MHSTLLFACLPACLLYPPRGLCSVQSCNDGVSAASRNACSPCCVVIAAMCSNYMARLDVANEEWHNCEGPQLSRLHAGVAGAAGEGASPRWLSTIGLVGNCFNSQDQSVIGLHWQLAWWQAPHASEGAAVRLQRVLHQPAAQLCF